MSRKLPELVSRALRPTPSLRLTDFISALEAPPSIADSLDARAEGFVDYQLSLVDRFLRVFGPWSSADEPLKAATLLLRLLRERERTRGKGGRPAIHTKEQLSELVATLERDRVRFRIGPGRGAAKATIEKAVNELENERGKAFRAKERKRLVAKWQKIVSSARTAAGRVNPKTPRN